MKQGPRQKLQKSKLCPGGSVGAVIQKGEDYLVLYRKTFPTGLAFIAGHGEPGEMPEDTLKREVKEECNLTIKKFHVILNETLENRCNRGYDKHEWMVYKIDEWEGQVEVMEQDKHKFVKFMSQEEILKYAEQNDIDPAWHKIILPALNIL